MKNPKNHKITITNPNGTELSLTISWGADIYEWAEKLRLILRWVTFSDKLIEEILGKENEDV